MAEADPFAIVPRSILGQLSALGFSETLVWVALATFADRDGTRARPCQATIAESVNLTTRAVRKALVSLQRAGLVRVEGYHSRGVVEWALTTPGPEHVGTTVPRSDGSDIGTVVPTSAPGSAARRNGGSGLRRNGGSYNQTLLPDPLPDHSPLRACEAPVGSADAPPPVNSPDGSGGEPEVEERAAGAPLSAPNAQEARRPAIAPSRGSPDARDAERLAAAAAARAAANGAPAPTAPRAAAPPSPPPDPNRPGIELEDAERIQTEVQDLYERNAGSHVPPNNRFAVLERLVRAYRKRWPHSWPSDWGVVSEMPGLTGPVKDRAAWIWAHVNGYALEGWKPENRDGSERAWHVKLLAGELGEAVRSKQIEASYVGENAARKEKRHGRTAMHNLRRLVDEDPALKKVVTDAVRGVSRERLNGGELPHALPRGHSAGSREAGQ